MNCTVPRDTDFSHNSAKFPHSCQIRTPPDPQDTPLTADTRPHNHGRRTFTAVTYDRRRAHDVLFQADVTDPQVAADLKKKRTFRTFSYRGIELDKLLDMSNEDVRAAFEH